MSHLRTFEQIPQLLEGFQEIRQARFTETKASEMQNAALVTMPPGPARDGRDASLRASVTEEDWDDTALREQYDTIGAIFGYNAIEKAEDWWLKWGILGDTVVQNHITMDLFSNFSFTKIEVSRV
jgi:salicylate hydroxylase